MDDSAKHIAESCAADSDAGAPFPEIVDRLMAAGFERYHTDLRRSEKTFYMPDGKSCVVACEPVAADVALQFSSDAVRDAVKTIQRGAIDYKEFCARIAGAGCVAYLVSFPGRRAVYYGRTADIYVEYFPDAA